MKSFDKFQYDQTDLQELKIGERMSAIGSNLRSRNNVTQRTTGITADTYRKNPGLRRRRIEQERQAALNPKPRTVNSQRRVSDTSPANPNAGSSIVKKPSATKGSNIPKRTNSGIKSVMDRTKKNIKKKAESQSGRATGRALAGGAKALLSYNPDKERTDTGQGGMGTAKRQRSGFLKSAIKGAVDAPSERINPKQRKTLGGKLLAIGKEKLQDRIGIEPTARTGQGRKLTGGVSRATDRERTERIAKNVEKAGLRSRKEAKKFVDTAPTSEPSTQLSGVSDKDLSKTKTTGDESQFKSNQTKTDQTKVTGNKDFKTFQRQNNPDQQQRLMYGNQRGPSSESMPTTSNNSNTSSTPRQANQTKVTRRNIKNKRYYDTDEKTGKKTFNQQRYDADKGRTTTKSGGGRPRKTTTEGTMNLSKILEANRIAAEREIKNQYGSVSNAQMRTPDQMKKDDARKKLLQNRNNNVMQNQNNESYSHWREEFIWETDKKYPEKVKEIKPMSGKNTITINPEDETSKYKRGY